MTTTPSLPLIKEVASTDQTYELLFKILLAGNTSVGKSSIFLRFVDNIWNDAFVPTIGVDFKIKTLNINYKNVKLQIWDTAGEERFRTIISSYYRGAHGILLIFDLTEIESFNNLNNWLAEIEKNANKNVVKVLIGNKCDLEDKRVISFEKAKDFADSNNMQYIETSAKIDKNITNAFGLIGKELMDAAPNDNEMKSKQKNITIGQSSNIDINEKKKNRCCGDNH